MQIRLLLPADADAYRRLRLRALREHPEAFTSSHEAEALRAPEWHAQRLAGTDTQFWGAWADGQLFGVVGVDREQRVKNRHKGTVVGLYVAPEFKGLHAGRALLEAAVAQARIAGIELLVLTVTAGNDAALHLYERLGFRSFGVEPRAIKVGGQPFDKNHMFLELAPSAPS